MKVHLAFLAEAANYSESGNISAVGIIVGRVEADSLPMGMPRLDFVISLIFEGDDLDRSYLVRTRALNPDGQPFHNESQSILDASRPPDGEGDGIVHTAIINHTLIVFDRVGDYHFEVYLDDDLVVSVGLRIHFRSPANEPENSTDSLVTDMGEG